MTISALNKTAKKPVAKVSTNVPCYNSFHGVECIAQILDYEDGLFAKDLVFGENEVNEWFFVNGSFKTTESLFNAVDKIIHHMADASYTETPAIVDGDQLLNRESDTYLYNPSAYLPFILKDVSGNSLHYKLTVFGSIVVG